MKRLLTLLLAALATAGVPVPADAAPAGDQPTLVITGLQPSAGRVEFFLAARGLPPGATLAGAQISVQAAGQALPTAVRAVPRTASGAPGYEVVLVLDASGSMAGERIAAARTAAADYAAAAPAGVLLGLVTVSDHPATLLAPTGDRAAFTAALSRVRAGGGTALYDGIGQALRLLPPAAGSAVDRRLVVLSDGADTDSRTTLAELHARLTGSAPRLDAIAYGSGADRAGLTALADVTGGRVLPAGDAVAVRAAFQSVAAELSTPVIVTATVPAALAGRAENLQVRVAVRGATATAGTPVTFRADAAAAPPPARVVVPRTDQRRLSVALGAFGAGVFLLVLLALLPLLGRDPIRRRIGQLEHFAVGRRANVVFGPSGPTAQARGVLGAALTLAERAVSAPERRRRVELTLDRAGSNLRPAEWLLVRWATVATATVLLTLMLPWWLGLPVGAAAGWFGSGQYLKVRAGRRARKFADHLPEALHLVVGSLRSGFSLGQAIDAVAREGGEPVATELGRALAETRLGEDLENALERVGERNGSEDMAWLVMAIRIQREVGGNLSETLETAVFTMRERARLARHVRALSAEGRLSAWVLLGMPVVLGGWMFGFRREYLRPLYTQPAGIAMLTVAVVLVVLGALWLRKLVQVRV